ncbi:response regulator transcription factor [Parapedobacter sp. ISTM3]|uniref:response regulator transcription factor n=1 Tax=Parapedobacter sp. ISTM3 TaxID=2800130 RepID=UPI00190680B5|nr:response regulator transcription factor [Parapedobacter sp. ISTM3]MBK1442687.1 response regulator transcription factor [Parapedobacter sp. ISTM3]
MPLNVIIADDHGAVRLGLKYMIRDWMPESRISYAKDMTELTALLDAVSADVIILDINLPGGNNFQVVKQLKQKRPHTRVLVFSAYNEMLYALRYIDAGADGYLQKDGDEEDFREAMNTVCRGRKYLSPKMRDYLLERRSGNAAQTENPLAALSDRETEVCQLLVAGKGVSEIANELDLHTSTVGTYKSNIYAKLAVQNLSELIAKVTMYAVTRT